MLEDFRDATPLEFAAFFEMKQFITGDVRAVSKLLLKQGYDGENIANLVFDFDTSGLDEVESFRMALIETGLSRYPLSKECAWIAIRYYLRKIIEDESNSIGTLSKLIDLERGISPMILFERSDLSENYVAQEWGGEKLCGIYYSSDDWFFAFNNAPVSYEKWLEARKEEQRGRAVSEAKRVLKKFYSLTSDLPEDLSGLRDFKNQPLT